MELALTGETITAERAAEVGLVKRLADPGNALDVALGLAGSGLHLRGRHRGRHGVQREASA
jgi:enoyl-CoA hydratase/carnithine racemase